MRSEELTEGEVDGLRRLGYDRRWIASGLLSRDDLAEQIQALDSPKGDQSTEHYRAQTLEAWLATKASLSDEEIATVLGLGVIDPDATLRSNFPFSLIRFEPLSDDQFEFIAGSYDDDAFRRLVSRLRLLRGLSRDSVSPAVVDEAVRTGDAVVHGTLLDRFEMTREQVEELTRSGANRAVRNRAAQLLRSRRYRAVID